MVEVELQEDDGEAVEVGVIIILTLRRRLLKISRWLWASGEAHNVGVVVVVLDVVEVIVVVTVVSKVVVAVIVLLLLLLLLMLLMLLLILLLFLLLIFNCIQVFVDEEDC